MEYYSDKLRYDQMDQRWAVSNGCVKSYLSDRDIFYLEIIDKEVLVNFDENTESLYFGGFSMTLKQDCVYPVRVVDDRLLF